ncbi:MAG: gliding motility-associated protein GldE [Bacteroidales bacterium]
MEEVDSDPYLAPFLLLSQVYTGQFSPDIVIGLIIIVILIIASGLVSGGETAFFSLTPAHLKMLNESGSSGDRRVLKLIDKPRRLLATILIANNFVNVGIVILSAWISSVLFDFSSYPILGFIVEVIAITALILMFGEIIPKILANMKPVTFSRVMAGPFLFLSGIFYPLSSLLVHSTGFIERKLKKVKPEISFDELSEAIELTTGDEVAEEETQILRGIVRFTDIDVKEIMQPRMDMVAIDSSVSFDEVIRIVRDCGFSRIPVYRENLDNIVGVLYVKDLLPFLSGDKPEEWSSLLRQTIFIPENKKINDLLQEFRVKKIHLAIVVDEYGGTSGLVTLEDILEEIVGDISDEFDTAEDGVTYRKINDRNFVFEGKTSIHDFCRICKLDDSLFDSVKGESDTIAGIILELTGSLPQKNSKISYGGIEFRVLTVDERRIKRVQVVLPEQESPDKAKENE